MPSDCSKKYPEYDLAYKKASYDKRRQDKTWPELFKEIARTLRYRNKKLHACSYEISAEELESMFFSQNGMCAYTGRILEKPITTDGPRNINVLSIDRIDSTGAYTPDNIALVCWGANVAKHEMSLTEFVTLCHQIAAKHPL